jgi:hypothetical protein
MTAWKSNFSPKRKRQPRLSSNALRRVTRRGRSLNAVERAEAIKQMHAEGRLDREVR